MQHLRYFLFVQLTLLLALILPVVLAGLLVESRFGAGALSAWLVVLYSSVRLGLLAMNGAKRLVSMTFWSFVYVWLGVTPMLQTLGGSFPLPGSYTTARIVASLGVVLVGLVAYDIGGAMARDMKGRWSSLYSVLLRREVVVSRAVAVGVVGLLVASVLVVRLGGIESLFGTRMELTTQIARSAGGEGKAHSLAFMTALRTPLFIAFYLQVAAFCAGWRNYRSLIVLAIFGICSLVVNNPINSPRYWLGVTVISVLFVAIPWKKAFSFSLYAAIMAVILLFIFPYSDMFRHSKQLVAPDLSNTHPLVAKGDYDAFQQLMNAVGYVRDEGVTGGRQIAGTALFWVPRSIWSTKPLPSGTLVGESLGYRYLNISLPLWGEAYLDGGVVGVVVMFVAYGYLVRRLETLYCESGWGKTSFIGVLVPLYAAYQIFFLRGALMSSVAYFVPMVVLLFVCTRPVRGDALDARASNQAKADEDAPGVIPG